MKGLSLRENLRIILAIAAKDISDAVRNKYTIGIILPTLAIVLIYRLIPQFTEVSGLSSPTILVYDAGDSTLVEALEASAALEVYEYDSPAVMEEKLAFGGDKNELGLVIPAYFDETLASGGQPVLDGYVLHWVTESQAKGIQGLVEDEIEKWAGKRIQVQLEGNVIYSLPDSFGFPVWGSLSILYVVMMIGVALTPHLILEEKQNKSMEALLVSPASSGQVVMGKALTGLFYCLTGAAIALALNAILVTHWWLVILVTVLGSFFAVALGLLLGTLFENRQQLTVWAMPVFAVLLLPVFIGILPGLLPEGILKIFSLIPTVAMEKVLRTSFSGRFALSQVGLPLLILSFYTILLLAAVRWALQRSDR
jgi:ABC-type Na+ efflux pump permease subunit